MALDLQTQEILDNAKHVWQRVGPWFTGLLTVALCVFLAWRGYVYWQSQKGEQAARAYDVVTPLLVPDAAGDKQAKLIAALEQLQKKHGDSIYAHMASLAAAKQLHSAQNPDAALQALQWLARQDDRYGYRSLVQLRAAQLYLDKKDFVKASAQLANNIAPAYKVLALDIQSDIYLAQNKPQEALAVLQQAWASLTSDDAMRAVVQEKISALDVDPTTLAADNHARALASTSP